MLLLQEGQQLLCICCVPAACGKRLTGNVRLLRFSCAVLRLRPTESWLWQGWRRELLSSCAAWPVGCIGGAVPSQPFVVSSPTQSCDMRWIPDLSPICARLWPLLLPRICLRAGIPDSSAERPRPGLLHSMMWLARAACFRSSRPASSSQPGLCAELLGACTVTHVCCCWLPAEAIHGCCMLCPCGL